MVIERTINWHEDQTKFMLVWYIDFKKDQHATFKFKKPHHFQCASALNRQFDMGVSVAQVDRHLRHYKENWKFIATALQKSGNSFDPIRCIVTVSESEKATLKFFKCQDRAKRLLSKPIKFFNEMQELFSNSSANGPLAMDPFGCMNDKADSDDCNDFNDMSSYAAPEDVLAEDSGTFPPPLQMPLELSLSGDRASSSSGIKHHLGMAPVNSGVKLKKLKTCTGQVADDISSTLQALKEALTTPPPPPPASDPHAALWE